MCGLCRYPDIQDSVPRERILSLLALLEHPEALHPEQALRLGGQLLVALGRTGSLRCEPVVPAEAAETTRWRAVS